MSIPRSQVELLQVGAVALGDNSHMNYGIWAPMINPTDDWPWGRTTRMRIAYCWDRDPDIAAAFAEKYDCEAVRNYDDMVGKVDGMIFAGFNEAPWWPQLARPYLEAGIPCHINRPFAYSMRDARQMCDLSVEHNAPILVTDERESIQEAYAAHGVLRELVEEGRTILGATSDNSAGNEYPQHGVHGLYYLLGVFGLDVAAASLQADGWWRETTAVVDHPMQYGLLQLRYRGIEFDGERLQDKPFVVSQQQLSGYGTGACNTRLYYTGGWRDVDSVYLFNIQRSETQMYHLFFPTVLEMQRLFETRQMRWSHEYILQKTRIFLAGFKSHLEQGGGMVAVDDLADDWKAPNPWPDWLDNTMFG